MTAATKVLIAESESLDLLALGLWLDQIPDVELVGTVKQSGPLENLLTELAPDVVILNLASAGPEALTTLRKIRCAKDEPEVLIVYQGDAAHLEGPLTNESKAQVLPKTAVKEIVENIKSVGVMRRSGSRLMAKAG